MEYGSSISFNHYPIGIKLNCLTLLATSIGGHKNKAIFGRKCLSLIMNSNRGGRIIRLRLNADAADVWKGGGRTAIPYKWNWRRNEWPSAE